MPTKRKVETLPSLYVLTGRMLRLVQDIQRNLPFGPSGRINDITRKHIWLMAGDLAREATNIQHKLYPPPRKIRAASKHVGKSTNR